MNVSTSNASMMISAQPAREAAAAQSRPETDKSGAAPVAPVQGPSDADEAQIATYVSHITRADAAQVVALTRRADTQTSYASAAAAYAEFE